MTTTDPFMEFFDRDALVRLVQSVAILLVAFALFAGLRGRIVAFARWANVPRLAVAPVRLTLRYGILAVAAVLVLGRWGFQVESILAVLGTILKLTTGVNLFSLLRYLGREFLLIVSTSSSETALPRLIAKMEHAGVDKSTVGVVVPTGYSFNLDGTAIYLTMASLFIAEALGDPLSIGEQVSLLVFMVIASKGAAGVTGAGLATLAGGLQSHRPDLVDGVGLIVGIDRFMSEARALTNFTGNAVATVLIGTWTKEIDRSRVDEVLERRLPFDEQTMEVGHGHAPEPAESAAPEREADRELAGAR